MKRVFIAINLPEKVREELEGVKQEIVGSFSDDAGRGVAKWVKKDNLHITMLFIGEVKSEKINEVCDKVKQAITGWKSFKVKIDKVCYGSISGGVPRLIWAETEENKDLECIGQVLGNKRFKGHITLARVRDFAWRRIEPEERPGIEKNLALEFEVKSVDIMESILKRTGPEYSILKSIKFT